MSETPERTDEAGEPVLEPEPTPDGAGLPLEPPESAAARLEEQYQEAQDRYLRLAAEFDNFRKRVARERIELADRAQASLTGRLLDVLDDLDRLAAQDADQTGPEVLHEALVLLDRKFRKELEGAGLARIDPVGSPFDPAVHEAVSVLPAPDPALDQTVSATFQTGYLFKGALVRPARVQVYSSEA
ncbi:MAG TPA: nucleotide exchange factor GrpE [Gemmatimonadales bacterium]|nr:nucleotide exchange factor GrpE [Gemmatimonadales bacterium]